MKAIILVVVVAVIAGLVLAVKFLPWWGLALLGVALLVAAKLAVKRLLLALLTAPFKMKGAVLREATAHVNAVVPTPAPADNADQDETGTAAGSFEYYELDVTISPQPANGKFTHWEPGELRLVRPDARNAAEDRDDDDSCTVKRIAVEQDGQFQPDEGFKFEGPQRLKLLLAVVPGTPHLKFRYYFEDFGEVNLPGPAAERAAA